MKAVTCPNCKFIFGVSEDVPKNRSQKEIQKQINIKRAKYLYDEGYTIRAIMKIMGFKSPRSIQKLLNQ
jgi:hypothetical protein